MTRSSLKRSGALLIALLAVMLVAQAQSVLAQELVKEEFSNEGTQLPRGWSAENALPTEHWNVRDGVLVTGDANTLPNNAPSFAVIDGSVLGDTNDYKVSVDFWMTADSGEVYLLARRRDPNTYYAAVLSAPENGRNSVRIERTSRGATEVLETRDTGVPSFADNSPSQQPVRFSFQAVGTSLEVRLDGIVMVDANDELPITSGSTGVGHRDNEVLFDRFVVEAAEATAAVSPIPVVPSLDAPTAALPPGPLVEAGGAASPVLPGAFGSPAPGAGASGYRVSIVSFPTQAQATETGEQIKADLGYWNTQVGPDGPNWMVFLEADSQSAAETLANELQQQGYFTATVIAPASSGNNTAPTPRTNRLVFANTPTFQSLTQAERQTVESLAGQAESAGQLLQLSQAPTVDPALQRKLEQMAAEMETKLNQLDERSQATVEVQQKLSELRSKANNYLKQDNIPAAQRVLEEMRTVDPNHSWVQLIEEAVERRTNDIRAEREEARRFSELLQAARAATQKADNPDAARSAWLRVTAFNNPDLLTPDIETEADSALRKINSKQAEKDANFTQEISAVRKNLVIVGVIVAILGVGGLIYMITTRRRVKRIMEDALPEMVLPELMEGLGPLGLEIKEAPLALPGQTEANDPNAGGSGAAPQPAAGSGDAFGAPHFSASASDLAPTPSELSASEKAPEPATDGDPFAKPVVAGPAPKPEPAPEPKPKPEPKSEESVPLFKPAPDTGGGLDLGGISDIDMGPGSKAKPAKEEAPKAEAPAPEAAPSPEPAESSPIEKAKDEMLDGILGDLPGSDDDAPAKSVEPAIAAASGVDASADASEEETLLELPKEEVAAGAGAEDDEDKPDFGDFGLGDSFEFTPPPEKAGSALAADSSSTSSGGVTVEELPIGETRALTFDQTPVGEKPVEWEGDFEFASLTVVEPGAIGAATDGEIAPDKALAYQKATGAGQIYYSITFPDAKGEVEIEFDLCCVDKNRYLLGVYLEKDRDFRHSIQTVIHRANPQAAATLRIQGKPVPYEMTKWAHIKFSLKMAARQIDAEVNGQSVIMGELMENMPDRVNTLAIRDNHPTTGKLMIANVKVTRIA